MAKMIRCKVCSAEMASTAKMCPQCGAKNKKSVYTKWWFWIIVIVLIIPIVSRIDNNGIDNKKPLAADNLGIWKIMYFVDDFGEPTKEKYITTTKPISGKYSLASTKNIGMRVCFIIENKESVCIRFESFSSTLVSKGYRISFNLRPYSFKANLIPLLLSPSKVPPS
jgi:RNA polymerase subunit RPABC4/transcription elongation factor Spt4